MAKPAPKVEVVTFPNTFRAQSNFIWILMAVVGWGMFGLGFAWKHGAHEAVPIVGVFTGIVLGLLLLVATLSVRVDDEGVHEQWLMVKKSAPWSDLAVMEKHRRAYALKTAAGRDLTSMSLLTFAQQEAMANEAVSRAGLRISRDKLAYPVIERWTK